MRVNARRKINLDPGSIPGASTNPNPFVLMHLRAGRPQGSRTPNGNRYRAANHLQRVFKPNEDPFNSHERPLQPQHRRNAVS